VPIYLIFIFLLVFSPCSEFEKDSNTELDRYFSKAQKKKGKHDFVVNKNLKNPHNLRLKVPGVSDENDSPLILALHWAGGRETFKEFDDCLISPAFDTLNSYIIIPDAELQSWHSPMNEKKIMELLKYANKNWNIDKRKVIVTGYSNGGISSWYFAQKYSTIFTAAIPIAGYYENDSKIDIPTYVIHGEKDELFPIDQIKRTVKSSNKNGSEIILKINAQRGHREACLYVQDLKNTIPWLEEKIGL